MERDVDVLARRRRRLLLVRSALFRTTSHQHVPRCALQIELTVDDLGRIWDRNRGSGLLDRNPPQLLLALVRILGSRWLSLVRRLTLPPLLVGLWCRRKLLSGVSLRRLSHGCPTLLRDIRSSSSHSSERYRRLYLGEWSESVYRYVIALVVAYAPMRNALRRPVSTRSGSDSTLPVLEDDSRSLPVYLRVDPLGVTVRSVERETADRRDGLISCAVNVRLPSHSYGAVAT